MNVSPRLTPISPSITDTPMFSTLKSWLRPAHKPQSNRPRLGLHHLEAREVPATLLNLSGTLVVDGTAGNDILEIARSGSTVRVLQAGSPDRMEREVITSLGVGRFPVSSYSVSDVRGVIVNGLGGNDWIDVGQSPVRATVAAGDGHDTVHGSAFNDFITGGNGNDRIAAHGGDDYLYGNDGDDVLEGGDGNDNLQGWNGNDRLFGQSGVDTLDGGMGDSDDADALHGVDVTSNLENSTYGGTELIVGGAVGSDIQQMSKPLCVFYSHASGMANILTARGRNLANERIDFKGRDASGNYVYDVKLFTTSGASVTRTVRHNTWMAGDADPVGGESWVTVLEKGYLAQTAAEGVNEKHPPTAMRILTGGLEHHAFIEHYAFWDSLSTADMSRMHAAICEGKLVTACTWVNGRGLATHKVVSSHCYTVMSVDLAAATITVRNPWGIDGGTTTTGDPNDGLITMTWDEFRGSFQQYNVGVVA